MKKLIILLLLITFFTTGCSIFGNDLLEDTNIVTTIYPIEYITKRLFGDSANIKSIYPKGTKIKDYTNTDKIIKDLSSNDIFIYNGNSLESDYALDLLNENKNIRIVDAFYGLSEHDTWLNPSNILMMATNIKDELNNYLANSYLSDKINERYELLKLDISSLETEFLKTAQNSNNNRIVTADENLKFLEKYGFVVVNLTENGKVIEKNLELAKTLFSSDKNSYIYVTDNKDAPSVVNTLVKNYNVNTLTYRVLEIITESDLENNEDYLSLMNMNIELIKKETY